MSDNGENIVRTTIRFEATLFDLLESFLADMPRSIRPSKDAAIQTAVRLAVTVFSEELRRALGSENQQLVKDNTHNYQGQLKKSFFGTSNRVKIPHNVDCLADSKSDEAGVVTLSSAEALWVRGFLEVIRGKNELAKTAIMTNILAFSDYGQRAPEVRGAGTDLDAIEARLATIYRQLVDETKAPDAGGRSNERKARKRAPRKASGE